MRSRLSDLRARLTWHRLPSALWALLGVVSAAALVAGLVFLPGEIQRGRAVAGERICGADPAPCLREVSGTLRLVTDREPEFVLRGSGPVDDWELRDTDGRVWEFWLWPDSEEELSDGGAGRLRVYEGGYHSGSVEQVWSEAEWWQLSDAGPPLVSVCLASVLVGLRSVLVVGRRLRARVTSLRRTERPFTVWWGVGRLPDGVAPLDPDFLAWWGVAISALVVTGVWGPWVYWVLAPLGLLLLHLVRRAVAKDKAAGWVNPFEGMT